MKLKGIIVVASMLALITPNVFAEKPNIAIDNEKITVTCPAEMGKRTALFVVKSGHLQSESEWVVAVKESEADSSNKAEFTFNMPSILNGESADGDYTVYIKSDDGNIESGLYTYVTQESKNKINELFKNVKTAEDLQNIFDNKDNNTILKGMGYEIDAYDSLSNADKKSMCDMIFSEISDFATASSDSIKNVFYKSLVVTVVNTSNNADEIVKALSTFSFEDKSFSDISDNALKSWIENCIKSHRKYNNYDALCNEYKISNILYQLNTARFSNINPLLTKYCKDLGIEQNSVYKDYLKSSSGTINEKLAAEFASKKPSTATELISAINSVLSNNKSDSNTPSYGGGGGGGSSVGNNSAPALVIDSDKDDSNAENPIFKDMDSAKWAIEAVNKMYERKIISGDESGNFRPNDNITREEFIKIIIAASGLYDENAQCSFDDVNANSWYYKYVASAVQNGIITGISENLFGSGNQLTRQDMAVICARCIGDKISHNRDDVEFYDEAEISDYAKNAVHTLYMSNMINGTGDNKFSPITRATRAQAAQMVYNIFLK